jgi:tetratricopeptide (TPR) repeat protein
LTGDYVPFDLTVAYSPDKTRLSINAKSDLGAASETAQFPFTQDQLNTQLARFAASASGRLELQAGELKRFGGQLFNLVFQGSVKRLFEQTQMMVSEGVRVDLDIQDPGLSQIPWELMSDGEDFLALSPKTPIIRCAPEPEGLAAQPPGSVRLPIRILFAGAKPWGQAPLNLGGQIRRMCRALRGGIEDGRVLLHPALGDEVQADRLLSDMRSGGYHILHISTHGAFSEELDKGIVALEDGLGNSFPVAIEAIAQRIRDTTIQLVYLDACETAQTSSSDPIRSLSWTLLRAGAGAAIAMQFRINDESATRFSEAFYYHLLKGEPLCKAVAEARVVLLDFLGRETIDWAIPVLHVRRGYEFATAGSGQPKVRFGHTSPPSRCLGRDKQLDELTETLLFQSRLVLVHGFGGIGKSTLVQKTLSEIELLFDDTCFVDCRGIKNFTDVVPKIIQMLAVNGYPVTEEKLRDLSKSGRIRHVCEQLDKGGFLLVLDNIEDMLDNPTTRELMTHVGQFSKAKLLVTCRIHSSLLDSQREVRLGSLETRYAIGLIREIGRDIPRIRDASDLDLRRINEKIGGHPYSIVTAVPFFSGLPFEEVLNDLPTRVGSEDEQSRRVLSWSYSKLIPEEQSFLENISVFAGEVPLQALLDMNEGKGEDLVRGLVAKKNMIEFDQVQLYSLHPLLREYAYARLRKRENFDQIQIKAAKEVAPKCLGDFWPEALRLYQLAIDSTRRTKDDETLASLLLSLGNLLLRTGEYRTATSTYKESLGIFEKLGDQAGIAVILHQLAMIEQDKGNYPEASRLYNESLEIKRKLGDQAGMAATLGQLATMEYLKGNYDEAKKLYDQVRDAFEKLGNQTGIAAILHQLAMIEQDKRNYPEAKSLYDHSLTIRQKLGDQFGIATTLGQLARLAEKQGDLEAAEKYYQQALEIFEKLGIKEYVKLAEKDLERVRKLKQKP